MAGFGKSLIEKTYTGKLYHSCTIEGLDELLNNHIADCEGVDAPIAFSTEASTRLFGRECVLVLEVENLTGQYTAYDADAGIDFGWDEFRVNFESGQEIFDLTHSVVMSEQAMDRLETEEAEWLEELECLIGSITATTNNKFYNF